MMVALRKEIGDSGCTVVEAAGIPDIQVKAEILDKALLRYERLRQVTMGDLLRALPYRCLELPRLILVGHSPFRWDSVPSKATGEH